MARDIAIQQIHVALTTNIEVLQNLSMGINFYTGFQEILNKLKRRSEEFASERARDKQDLLSYTFISFLSLLLFFIIIFYLLLLLLLFSLLHFPFDYFLLNRIFIIIFHYINNFFQ